LHLNVVLANLNPALQIYMGFTAPGLRFASGAHDIPAVLEQLKDQNTEFKTLHAGAYMGFKSKSRMVSHAAPYSRVYHIGTLIISLSHSHCISLLPHDCSRQTMGSAPW
jgi:hypothetical protein